MLEVQRLSVSTSLHCYGDIAASCSNPVTFNLARARRPLGDSATPSEMVLKPIEELLLG